MPENQLAACKAENERLRALLQQGYDPAAETISQHDRMVRHLHAEVDRMESERDQARDLAARAAEEAARLREALSAMAVGAWNVVPGRRHLADDREDGPGTGEEGWLILDEDENGRIAWTPDKGGAALIIEQHDALVEAAEAALAGKAPAEVRS